MILHICFSDCWDRRLNHWLVYLLLFHFLHGFFFFGNLEPLSLCHGINSCRLIRSSRLLDCFEPSVSRNPNASRLQPLCGILCAKLVSILILISHTHLISISISSVTELIHVLPGPLAENSLVLILLVLLLGILALLWL